MSLDPESIHPLSDSQQSDEVQDSISSPELHHEQDISPAFDLSSQLDEWFTTATALAQDSDAQEIQQHIRSMQQRLRYPGFRLAFVGEFNRGKSTLINRLLARSLLPVGAVSTTATITSIVAGQEEAMLIHFPHSGQNEQEQRPLTADSWTDLVAKVRPDEEREDFPQVRITINHPWLQMLDAEFVDTPGVNDSNGTRSALAFNELNSADAAVLLISAETPVSLTEAMFLEQEVIGRHIPHLLVAVSRLDMIAPEQRSLVMENIYEKIQAISSQIPVVATHNIDEADTSESALQEVRTHIESIAMRADRRAWRSRQLAATIAEDALELAKLAQIGLSRAHQTASMQQEALLNAQQEARQMEIEWQLIKADLLKRSDVAMLELRRRLDVTQAHLLDDMLFELSRTPDPKLWWERDFPFRLRQDLLGLSQNAESLLIALLEQDTQWLLQRVQSLFDFTLTPSSPLTPIPMQVEPNQTVVALQDIQKMRLFTRIGSGAATIVGYILLGPIGSAVSLGVGLLGDQVLVRRLKEQQQLLETEVRLSIELTIREYYKLVSERMALLYQQVFDDLQQQQSAWEASKVRVLAKPYMPDDEQKWQDISTAVTSLSQKIQTALGN